MRIAIIGSGISGIAAAKVLKRFGHDVEIFESTSKIGGVWSVAYAQVRLQNIGEHYRLTDFPFPHPVDEHPTAQQVYDYLCAAVVHFDLKVQLSCDVAKMVEREDGWTLDLVSDGVARREEFDRVIVASGLFTQEQNRFEVDGLEDFSGEVLTERNVGDLSVLAQKKVAVIGFGKTGIDLATFAAERGAQVAHIFRAPRWLLPRRLLGRRFDDLAAARTSTNMMPCWAHPNPIPAFVHQYLSPIVRFYWWVTEWMFTFTFGLHGFYRAAEIRDRMALLTPDPEDVSQIPSAASRAPDAYFDYVRQGKIIPHRGKLRRAHADGLELDEGVKVSAELIVAALGYQRPSFGFLPAAYRELMTGEDQGTQLYRHILHPDIPNLAFAGFNHGYFHSVGVEVAMVWYAAILAGQLDLPSREEMIESARRVEAWKRKNMLHGAMRAYVVGARFHQHIDVLLKELGINHRRKSNAFFEQILPYVPADYAGIFDEYSSQMAESGGKPRQSLPMDA